MGRTAVSSKTVHPNDGQEQVVSPGLVSRKNLHVVHGTLYWRLTDEVDPALLRKHNKVVFARQMVDSFRGFSKDLNEGSESFTHLSVVYSKHLSFVAAPCWLPVLLVLARGKEIPGRLVYYPKLR